MATNHDGYGYRVIESESGFYAITISERHAGEIHLVLTDVIMPTMNGRELLEKLQALRPEIKVLFMSGYTDDVIAPHGVLDDTFHFLPKPFRADTLARKVRDVLDT